LFCQYSKSVRHIKRALKITFPEEINNAPVKERKEERKKGRKEERKKGRKNTFAKLLKLINRLSVKEAIL